MTRYGFAPACLMKNIVNLCQFASAAQNLAIRDMQKRKNAVDPVLRTERRAQPQGSARRQNRGRAAALGARRAARVDLAFVVVISSWRVSKLLVLYVEKSRHAQD